MAMPHLAISSPLGPLTLFENDGAVIAIEFGRAPGGGETPLLREVRRQLDAYFDGRLHDFSLPLRAAGSPFQRSVWAAIAAIPYGQTRTYGAIAVHLGSAARAVGGACGRNPIPIVVPCHRVVGAGGRLTGYSGGAGTDTKRVLLVLEAAHVS
jgi:methylated-DNA-[protein]-cysteine S-methyltransferase